MSKIEIKIDLFLYFAVHYILLSCLTVIFEGCLCQNT